MPSKKSSSTSTPALKRKSPTAAAAKAGIGKEPAKKKAGVQSDTVAASASTSTEHPPKSSASSSSSSSIRKRLYLSTPAPSVTTGGAQNSEQSTTTAVQRRSPASRRRELKKKMAFYQTNKTIPTSLSTLKRQVKQFYELLADDGKLDLVKFTSNEEGQQQQKREKRHGGAQKSRGDIMITTGALELIHQTYTYYMDSVLQDAQTALMNGSNNMTLTTDLLDLGAHFVSKRGMGPQWGMILRPITEDNDVVVGGGSK